MKVYRVAAVSVATVLLVIFVVLLNLDSAGTPPTTSMTTVDTRNDGVVSESEAGSFGRLTVDVLNRIARVACDAVAVSPDRATVRQSVLAEVQQIRPNVSTRVDALTDRVARLACADAFDALP